MEVAPQLGAETHILSLAVFISKLYGGTRPNGKLYEWNGTELLKATDAMTVGTPAVIALVWAANDYRLYVNGVLIASATLGAVPVGTPDIYLGQDGGNANQLNGADKSLMIWNRALPADEVARNSYWLMGKVGLL